MTVRVCDAAGGGSGGDPQGKLARTDAMQKELEETNTQLSELQASSREQKAGLDEQVPAHTHRDLPPPPALTAFRAVLDRQPMSCFHCVELLSLR